MRTFTMPLAIITLLSAATLAAHQHSMPPGTSHEEHLRQMQKDAALDRNGAAAMGFDQDKAAHHFLLQQSGGAIVVTSKEAADVETVAQIRRHLREIADSFAAGRFDNPLATHGELPPGSAVMTTKRTLIAYRYEERAGGGSVVMQTADPETLSALHAFLRYQIVEHKTGDPLTPQQ